MAKFDPDYERNLTVCHPIEKRIINCLWRHLGKSTLESIMCITASVTYPSNLKCYILRIFLTQTSNLTGLGNKPRTTKKKNTKLALRAIILYSYIRVIFSLLAFGGGNTAHTNHVGWSPLLLFKTNLTTYRKWPQRRLLELQNHRSRVSLFNFQGLKPYLFTVIYHQLREKSLFHINTRHLRWKYQASADTLWWGTSHKSQKIVSIVLSFF